LCVNEAGNTTVQPPTLSETLDSNDTGRKGKQHINTYSAHSLPANLPHLFHPESFFFNFKLSPKLKGKEKPLLLPLKQRRCPAKQAPPRTQTNTSPLCSQKMLMKELGIRRP